MTSLDVGFINTTLDLNDDSWDGFNFFVVDASGGSITITMENITVDGIYFYLQRVDASENTVTLQPVGDQTLNGSSSYMLAIGTRVLCVSENSNYLIA